MSKRISKMLFSKERVELGLIDDALKFVERVETGAKNIDIDEKELNNVKTTIEIDIDDLQGNINALKKGIQAVESAAKDLGVSPNDIPKYKLVLNRIEYGEKQLQKGKQLLK